MNLLSSFAGTQVKNLKDILVKAKIETRNSTRKRTGFQKCKRSCVMCSFAVPSQKHTNPITGASFYINSHIDCTSKNVIYKLGCKKCGKFLYIGETSRRICDRFQEHRGYVTQKNLSQPTGSHFTQAGHSVCDLTIQGIELVKPVNEPFVLKTREAFWITKYNSTKHGNNTKK